MTARGGSSGDADAPDDARVLQRVAEGDRRALAELHDRFAPTALALAERIVGASGPAEALVHDLFLEAWLSARYYEPACGTVRSWLLLRLRARALRHRAEMPDVAALRPASSSDPLQPVLEAVYFQGASCAEIASALQVPVATVELRLSRSLAQLRAVRTLASEKAR